MFVVFETKSSFFALINQFLLFFLFLSIIKQNKKIIGRRKHSSLKKKKISASHKAREEGAKSIHNPEAKNARKKKRFLLLHRYDALLLPNTIEREHIFSPETIA